MRQRDQLGLPAITFFGHIFDAPSKTLFEVLCEGEIALVKNATENAIHNFIHLKHFEFLCPIFILGFTLFVYRPRFASYISWRWLQLFFFLNFTHRRYSDGSPWI